MFFQKNIIKELQTILNKNKNNIKMVLLSKRIKELFSKHLKNNKVVEIIKLIMKAQGYTPLELPGNGIAYIVNDKQVKLSYTFNNKTKILSYKINGKTTIVNLQSLSEYLKSIGEIKNISIVKKNLIELAKNLK